MTKAVVVEDRAVWHRVILPLVGGCDRCGLGRRRLQGHTARFGYYHTVGGHDRMVQQVRARVRSCRC